RNYLPVDARIFQRALAPSLPYYPKPAPMAIAALVGTMLLMSVLILLQELFSGRALKPAPGGREDVPVPLPEITKVEPEHRVREIVSEAINDDQPAPALTAVSEMDVTAAAGALMSAGVER